MSTPREQEVSGATNGTGHGTGTDAWGQALRDRCEQLRKDVHAGRVAERGLDELDGLTKTVGVMGHELHEIASAALWRATEDLNEYDRQSQGALETADERVREARKALEEFTAAGAVQKLAEGMTVERQIKRLEGDVSLATEMRTANMDGRVRNRAPVEERRTQALANTVLASIARVLEGVGRRDRLEDLAEAGQRAAAELRDLERARQSATGSRNTTEVTITSLDCRSLIAALDGVRPECDLRYPAAGGKPGDIHRDTVAKLARISGVDAHLGTPGCRY